MSITMQQAEALAIDALADLGADGPVEHRELKGCWRFWAAPEPGAIGNVHVLVSAASGAVVPVSGGLLDSAAEQVFGPDASPG